MPRTPEGPPGRPETTWRICEKCNGSGKVDGKTCRRCGGKGKVPDA